jgi:hypothetical protein
VKARRPRHFGPKVPQTSTVLPYKVFRNSSDINFMMLSLRTFIFTFVLLATPVITAFFWPSLENHRCYRSQNVGLTRLHGPTWTC